MPKDRIVYWIQLFRNVKIMSRPLCLSYHEATMVHRLDSLQWNHQPHDCLLNLLFRRRSKKTSKLRVTGLCVGNSPHKWPVTRKTFTLDDVIMSGLHRVSMGHDKLVVVMTHQMEAFSALLANYAGNSPVTGESPPPPTHTPQRPVTRSFDAFFDLRLNKRLSKQS